MCRHQLKFHTQAGGLYDVKFHTCHDTLKDEKQHDAVDKSTSKQQVCVLDGICLCCAKNWTYTPSASGSYGRQADESLNFFKML